MGSSFAPWERLTGFRRLRRGFGALLAVCCLVGASLDARPAVAQANPGVDLEVWMLTFGPGEPVFLKFGHNALLVRGRDPTSSAVVFEKVYDYGLFNGASPTLVADFLQGRMDYWVGVTSLRSTMRRYKATNRDVFAQKLRLTTDQAIELFRRLETNIRPENRFYRYDYYYDNCSTRLRDILDVLTDGALKRAFTGPASLNLREHSLRHTADDWKYYLGLDLGLANVDDEIDIWVESFLPYRFRDALRRVVVTIDGKTVPFVEREETWFKGSRPEVPDRPPDRIILLAAIGFLLGGIWAGWGWLGRRSVVARWTFRVVASLLAVVLSLFGWLLVFLWGFTDHSIAYGNENIFHLAPWAIVTPVAAVLARRPRQKLLVWVLGTAAAFSILGLIIKVVPGFDQSTYRIIGLLLPTWIGLAVGAWWIAERPAL